eukprot:106507-Pelagomonas_calceolata.AAC.2
MAGMRAGGMWPCFGDRGTGRGKGWVGGRDDGKSTSQLPPSDSARLRAACMTCSCKPNLKHLAFFVYVHVRNTASCRQCQKGKTGPGAPASQPQGA